MSSAPNDVLNPSRPIPRANTGSALLDAVANASTFLVRMQRRVDPWLRPAFDALLRDPLAAPGRETCRLEACRGAPAA